MGQSRKELPTRMAAALGWIVAYIVTLLVLGVTVLKAQDYAPDLFGDDPAAAGTTAASSTIEARAQRHTERMQQKLNLSQEQVAAVYSVNLQAAQGHDALTAQGLRGMQRMMAMRDIEQTRDASLRKVFTPEQRKVYDELREQQRMKMRERMTNGGRGRGRGRY